MFLSCLLMIFVYFFVILLVLLVITKWFLGMPVYCHSSARLDGKTVIVTGGNAGVGFETAVDMATRGARVILGCRNEERAQAAVKAIKGVGRSVLYEGVKTTKQGYEIVFGTNYLGPFLLTYLFIDLLKKSAPSQVINLSSFMHYFLWRKMTFKEGKIDVHSYKGSKIGNIMHARELAKRYKDFGIRANSVHPGVVDTEIWTPMKRVAPLWFYKAYRFVLRWLALDCKGGAQTTIYVAVDEAAQKDSGEYFSACGKKFMNPLAKDEKACEELWEESMKECGLC